ncbi:polyprenyl synthetase family protein [Nocardioides flavescens]|uniref:Polyprenyl synthetase family protein n=1 Tax=Nocardioides flavescens TaxID=2691959 RepID=A0A6L7F3J4_9ACTN|nr:polyprenyl synthetase family protein [Nocardioides flavescens]
MPAAEDDPFQDLLGARTLGQCGTEGVALHAALRHAVVGGKRFRPWLVGLTHDSCAGTRPEAVAAVGAGVELLHTAFVVHDDVIDGDRTRRGRPSVPEGFRVAALGRDVPDERAELYGLAGAVLTGDLALAAAVRAVATAPVPPAVTHRLLDLVDQALAVTAAGELADVRLATHPGHPTLADVLSMEERKTAVYSFALPMQLGAVLADAPDEVVHALGEVGRHLGLAFQLQDDLLGVFGDSASTGKSTVNDLREGKCTALITHARSTAGWLEIEPHWGAVDLDDARAALVRDALERCGSRGFVEDLVTDYVATATDAGAAVGLPAALLSDLAGLCTVPVRGAA